MNASTVSDTVQAENFLGRALIRQDTFICREVYSDDVSFNDLYSHRAVEISMVTAGSGVHKIVGQTIPCKTGDIYIINSGVPHRYFASDGEEPLTVRRLMFDPRDWFDEATASASRSDFCYGVFADNPIVAYATLTQSTLDKVMSLCDSVAIELLEKKSEWHSAAASYLALVLITVRRYVNMAIKNAPNFNPILWTPISAVIAAVLENYKDPNMTLESIAKSFYISKSHLSRLFKQVTGESFSDYLRNVRLAGACTLLVETDMNIDEIVARCGMRDTGSFYKIFSEHFGMTPNQYRKTNKKTNITGEKTMSILVEISENLQKGKGKIVKELVQQALDAGVKAQDILEQGLLAGMSVIGEKFKNNEVYVPEVLVAARAMNMGVQVLKPYLAEAGVQATGKVCIGTVLGDLHDIGKNLVKMMMEGKGLEVVDLGTDVAPEVFIQAAIEQGCQVICCSALLTTTMGVMADVVKAAEAAGIRDKVKIMIGGAPINQEFCNEIGADCYTVDAASAADAAVMLCKA